MSIFRNNMGRRYLRGLFFEECGEDKASVVYTLKREDHLGFPSLYRLYMLEADPTEYRFACKYLDGWSHWTELSASSWFQPYLAEWREELEVSLRSKALASILSVSEDTANPSSYHANKYLLDAHWKPAGASKPKSGRPTKASIKEAAHDLLMAKQRLDEDEARIAN